MGGALGGSTLATGARCFLSAKPTIKSVPSILQSDYSENLDAKVSEGLEVIAIKVLDDL
jgi:hypothetical protein